MRVTRSTIIRFVIGVALLALIIWYSKPAQLWAIVSGASVFWLAVAVVVHIVATSATSLRIAYLSDRLDLFWPIFKANLGGMLLGDVTPGRAGYFATPLIVNKNCPDLRKGRVLNVLFFGQIFDFLLRAILLATAILTIFYALNVSQDLYLYGLISLALVMVLTAGFAMLAFGKVPRFAVSIIDRVPLVSRLYHQYTTYIESATYSPKKAGGAFLITIAGWLLTALRWITVGYALGLEVPLVWYLFLFPALTAVSFIPVSLAGLGMVEGGFALVFLVLGQAAGSGIAFALVDRFVALMGDLPGLSQATNVGVDDFFVTDDKVNEHATDGEVKDRFPS